MFVALFAGESVVEAGGEAAVGEGAGADEEETTEDESVALLITLLRVSEATCRAKAAAP